MIKKISIKTKIGWISVFEEKGKVFKIQFGKIKKQTNSLVLNAFKQKIKKFFKYQTTNINIPHKLLGNRIQKKIWNELKKINFGNTKSYGTIAKKYNISPRYVGKICGQNKLMLLVPCHRVIKSDGSLGGFTSVGGVNLKKKILEFEKKI